MGTESAGRMKSECQFKIVPSRRVFSTVESLADWQGNLRVICKSCHHGKSRSSPLWNLWIVYSGELDAEFIHRFREYASAYTRLLVFNEGQSSDTLASRLTSLQIRSANRFYVADVVWGTPGTGKSACVGTFLQRLASVVTAKDSSDRVFDAKIEGDILRVVSPDFRRLEVPVSRIPNLESANRATLEDFKIDSDGSYIFWPKLDVHLGWEQLEQIVNPESALKARQKAHVFNVRYGNAIRRVREEAGIAYLDITGISEKQLRRIEKGDSRLTTNAAEALAAAHKLSPNEYLNKVAKALE